MEWATDTTTTLEMPAMKAGTTPRRRKRIAGPPLPETGEERAQQVRKFVNNLADLYDSDHCDVYESVFFTRVGDIMVNTVFDDSTNDIRLTGQQILDTRATSVKLYIAFFNAVLGYLDTL